MYDTGSNPVMIICKYRTLPAVSGTV